MNVEVVIRFEILSRSLFRTLSVVSQELEKLRDGLDPASDRWGSKPTIGEELQHVMDRFAAMQPTGACYVFTVTCICLRHS